MTRFYGVTDAQTGKTSFIPFTAAEEAAADAAQVTTDAEIAREAAFTADPTRADILNRLQTATPTQLRNYVQTQVTDLPSARNFLANLLVLIALDQRS